MDIILINIQNNVLIFYFKIKEKIIGMHAINREKIVLCVTEMKMYQCVINSVNHLNRKIVDPSARTASDQLKSEFRV